MNSDLPESFLSVADTWSDNVSLGNAARYPTAPNLVFIDPTVEDYQSLSAGVKDAEVVILAPGEDGIEQITEILGKRSQLSSVQIISHGTAANLYLGSAQLTLNNLDDYASSLQRWADSLTPDADLLLYGCHVAAGAAGNAFLQELSQQTGADVAASGDRTGSAALGGDWVLEASTGSIESTLALRSEVIDSYDAVFDVRVEAESMALSTYYVDPSTFTSASQERLITLSKANQDLSGTASFDFDGSSGNYNVVLGYYDESDGVSQLQVKQGNTVLDSWLLDEDTQSSAPNAKSFRTRTVATQRPVDNGDDFVITGTRNTDEYNDELIRVDYIDFISAAPDSSFSTLALSNNAYSVDENDGSVKITVVRTDGTDETVSLDYRTVDDSATAGADYTQTSGTLSFEPGETRKQVAVPIINDTSTEETETVNFVIDDVEGNATLGRPRTAQITIADNDQPLKAIRLVESNGSTRVTEEGGSDTYSLIMSRKPTADVTIDLASDSQLQTNSTITFTPDKWNYAQNVTVRAVDDSLEEGDHSSTISHTVSSADSFFDGVSLADISVSILDDDTGTFVLETFPLELKSPTAFDWSPDGEQMFVAQKNGVVRVVEDGSLLSTPFIDISDQVNNASDRGLLGIAVHPDFESNPYVYLAFTYDPPEVNQNTELAGPDGDGNRPSRVIRVTADASTDYTTAVPDSEAILLGKNSTWENISRPDKNSTFNLDIPPSGITPEGKNIQDYLATDSQSHSIGAVRFGTDGSLFVSNGDGTSYNKVDPRTVRVQDIDNLSGKILRIDPITGEGLADNPFYNGDPDSNRSKVYSYGLRNPFRFTINPKTNEPFISDVGWTSWEEINTGRGVNFGWPYYEGGNGESLRTNGYSELSEAQEFYESGQSVTPAISARSHEDGAIAVIMGDFYTGETFPDRYDDALFFSDYGDDVVRYLTFDEAGDVDVNTFSDDVQGLVQLSTGPDSNLYYASLDGEIGRWRFDSDPG